MPAVRSRSRVQSPSKSEAKKAIENAFSANQHTFHVEGSNAAYSYTDADAALVKAAFQARVAVDKADEALSPALVRIFGADWTKEGAPSELKKPIRDWIRAVLPEYQALVVQRARYSAAAQVGAINRAEANSIRQNGRDIESKITRMIESSAKAWRLHVAAQSEDFEAAQKARTVQTTVKILEDCHAKLDKRAGRNQADSDTAKRCATIVGQLPERVGLFQSVMRFGATHKLSDHDVGGLFSSLTVEEIGVALARVRNKPVE